LYVKNPNIVIIGAGRIASSLLNGLIKSNFNVVSVFSKNINSAKLLAEKYSINNYSNNISEINETSNLFLLTVPDNQIELTAQELCKSDINFSDSLFVHFSGALSFSVLDKLKCKNSDTASFHIMQSFPTKDVVPLKGLTASIETDSKKAENFLFSLAEKLEMNAFKLFKEEKVNYHLAGVYSSNFFVGNLLSADNLLKDKKTKFPEFGEMILPIVTTTLNNVKTKGIKKSLSGPMQRGELEVIKKHIKKIKDINSEKFYVDGKNIFLFNYITQSLTVLKLLENDVSGLNDNQKKVYDYLVEEFNFLINN